MTATQVDWRLCPEQREARNNLTRWGFTEADLRRIDEAESHTFASVQQTVWRLAEERGCSPKAVVDALYQPPRKRARSQLTGIDQLLQQL